jgi:hypothetical protein
MAWYTAGLASVIGSSIALRVLTRSSSECATPGVRVSSTAWPRLRIGRSDACSALPIGWWATGWPSRSTVRSIRSSEG